jgi:hypothetical protein
MSTTAYTYTWSERADPGTLRRLRVADAGPFTIDSVRCHDGSWLPVDDATVEDLVSDDDEVLLAGSMLAVPHTWLDAHLAEPEREWTDEDRAAAAADKAYTRANDERLGRR